MVTGIRSLCTGLGPALYGVIFYFFNVNLDLNDTDEKPEEEVMENPMQEVRCNKEDGGGNYDDGDNDYHFDFDDVNENDENCDVMIW